MKRIVAILLLFVLLSTVVASAGDLEPPRYSYKEAQRTQRRYKRVVRYYQRQNRRDLRDLRQEHAAQQRELKRDKKHKQSLIKPSR
jgi:hypothetical protein